ncbi:MAG: PAS domain S-box protein [Crinalium sp.]
MVPEQMQILRESSRDDIALKLLPNILSAIETRSERTQMPISFQAALLDQVCNAVIATDVEGKIIYWNRFAQSLFQWTAEEVIGKHICNVIIAKDIPQVAEAILVNPNQTSVWQGSFVTKRKDDTQFVADVTHAVIQDDDGLKGFLSVYVDATDRKRSEIALKQSAANLKAIFNSSLQAVVMIDWDYKIQAFNKTANDWAIKIYHKSLNDFYSINDFLIADELYNFHRAFNAAIKGKSIKIEKLFTGIKGDNHWFEITYCPVLDEAQQVIGVCQVALNIDQQKKAIDELAKSEERFRSLVQNSSDIITILEENGVVRYVSPSVKLILGYQPEDIVGKNVFDYIHPQDKSKAKSEFAERLKQPGVVGLSELRLHHGAGKWIEVEVAVNNLLPEASTKGVVVNCRDISERKQAEIVLKQQTIREQALHRFTRMMRSYLDLETICAIAAQEITQILRVERVEIKQYLPYEQVWLIVAEYPQLTGELSSLGVQVPDVDYEITTQLKQLQVVKMPNTNNEDPEISQINAKSSGAWLLVPLQFQQHLWGSLNLCNYGDEWQQAQVELVSAIADQLAIAIQQAQLYQQSSAINADLESQVQERTAQLEQKVEELEQLNILKDDFLSTVSHELRTPLSNMKMAIQMLKIAPSSERRQRYLDILESECARETELINDLLDLQRLEVASYSITLEKINLQEWIPTIITPFYSRVQQHQQDLKVNLSPDLPIMVSDRTSLGRIISELLHNACKYTPPGDQIIFNVSYTANYSHKTVEQSNFIIFTITNQAEIPASELPRIFDKFYRVPNADPWKQGGTGLGLALVQKLIGQMEGTIQVESSGGWTTFTVQIPHRPSDHLRSANPRMLT